ncbi:YeeE/YedE thiosulfate transporter family protein [Microcoleus sp. S13_C5]
MFHKKLYRLCEVFVMGYGGLLAFGCNVGAFFSGIASISLHGWL